MKAYLLSFLLFLICVVVWLVFLQIETREHFFVFVAAVVDSQVAALADKSSVQLPVLVQTTSGELYSTALVITVLAKTF